MSLNPSYAPPGETSEDIWTEITLLIGETVLCGWTYGILCTLYVLSLDAIIPQLKKKENRNWAIFHIAYITAILILVGAGTASDARVAQLYWINNRNFPGGPLQFINHDQNLSELVWGFAVYVVASWLQDAYVIYRCLVFWNFDFLVCGLPLLCFIGSLASSIALLFETSNAGQGVYGRLTIDFAICWYIFSISINVLATIAIVGRLIWKRKEIVEILGKDHSKPYTGVVAMLVESAAIYSIVGLIFIGNYFRRNPVGNLVLPPLGNLEGICPLMIIYRIAIGRGWTHQTMRQVNSTVTLSTLQFSSGTKSTPTNRRNTLQQFTLPGVPDSSSEIHLTQIRSKDNPSTAPATDISSQI